ncbi:hypothetical protein ABK040_005177 [Willaertia magna]
MLKESVYFAILFCFCIAIIVTEGSSLPIIRNVKDSGDCIAISEPLEPGKQAEFKGMKGDETHGTIVYTVQLKSVVNPFGDILHCKHKKKNFSVPVNNGEYIVSFKFEFSDKTVSFISMKYAHATNSKVVLFEGDIGAFLTAGAKIGSRPTKCGVKVISPEVKVVYHYYAGRTRETANVVVFTLTAVDGKNRVISKVTPLSLDDKQPFYMVYDFERDLNGTYRFTIDVRENNVISLNGKLEIEGYEKDVSQIIASWF